MAPRRAAAASESHVAEAARDALRHGNAVDAVVAGVLAAVAETPSVLLGPLQVLVGGAGAGVRAVDGRVRQPGFGVPRPRGFLAGEAVPAQARVGVPALPTVVASLIASLGSATQLRLTGPAIARARARSVERARLLESFAHRGASALVEDAVLSELTAVAGRGVHGLLTREDLVRVRPVVVSYDDRMLEPSGILTAPWRSAAAQDASWTHVVAAADTRGLFAVACYEAPLDGVAIPALGLVAPAFATPVLRGEVRVRPGQACPTAAPIALRVLRGIADLAFGLAEAAGADTSLEAVVRALSEKLTAAAALASATEGRSVAIVREGDRVTVLASR